MHQCTQSNFHWPVVYDRYITGLCMSYVNISLCCTFPGPPGLPGALCRVTPAPLADLLRFSNRETCNTRLWPAKVPKPSLTSYTWLPLRDPWPGPSAQPNSKSRPCRVLVWNDGGGVAIKEAWKEWNPAKEVLNLANVERRNGWWLIKLSDSVRLDGASESQAKVLKGAEKHQVELKLNR
jgi:hypothetical protein